MARLGHSSPQAALRYQHASRDRDSAIAVALNELITGAKVQPAERHHRTLGTDQMKSPSMGIDPGPDL